MGDSVTPSGAALPQVLASGAPAGKVTFLQVPPELQQQKQISGEVVAVKDDQVTLKTPQGLVTFQTDAEVQVGQKILLKLQNAAIQLQTQSLAQILVQTDRGDIRAAPIANTTKPSIPAPALPPVTVSQAIGNPEALQNVRSAPAQIALLPQELSEVGQTILLKQALNLLPQQPLPPPLLEALVKTQELRANIKAAAAMPSPPFSPASNTVQAVPEPQLVEQLLTYLQGKAPLPQMLQGATTSAVQNAPTQLQASMTMPLVAPNANTASTSPMVQILTALPPGVSVTSEIVQKIIQNLQHTTPQSLNLSSVPLLSEESAPQVPLIAMLLGPQQVTADMVSTSKPAPQNFQQVFQQLQNYTAAAPIPASTTEVSGVAKPSLMPMIALVTLPDGQQALSVIHVPSPVIKTTLPGTVLVMAVPQNTAEQLPHIPMATAMPLESFEPLTPFHPGIGKEWDALQTIWRQMQIGTLAVPEAAAALQQSMPNLSPQHFTPAVLLFMALVKNGVALPWTDEKTLMAMPPEKSALLSQLARDMGAIQSAMNDTGSVDGWRPLPTPLQLGDQLVRLQWFYRHHTDDAPDGRAETEEERRKRRKTRFLLDVPQTRLGDIQIDGLVQPKQLDIILRTEDTLQAHQRVAIGERFQAALEVTGFAGGISFQDGAQNYVRI